MTYLLGHADSETRRLMLQARLYDGHTEHALRMAGLRPGMRVLDVGCGAGDMSFLAARLVGPTGRVLGVDASGDVVELARSRAEELGISTVRFEQSTIDDIDLDEPVDAVIGRLILLYLPDPIDTLHDLAELVRPGGLIAFSEYNAPAAGPVPETPLCRAVTDATINTYIGMGADPASGANLHQRFRRAGLGSPRMTLGAPVAGADDIEALTWLAETWRSVFPAAQRLGVAGDELADLDTLLPRVQEELAAAQAVFMLPPLITAWARV